MGTVLVKASSQESSVLRILESSPGKRLVHTSPCAPGCSRGEMLQSNDTCVCPSSKDIKVVLFASLSSFQTHWEGLPTPGGINYEAATPPSSFFSYSQVEPGGAEGPVAVVAVG